MLTQRCNCIRSTSEYVRQACHCGAGAARAYDSTSEAAIGRACMSAIDCDGDPLVAFGQLVEELGKLFRGGDLRREQMLWAIAEVGAILNISPSLQARIAGTVKPPAVSAA